MTAYTRFTATSPATRKDRAASGGFDTLEAAKAQAEFLATNYGGVATVARFEYADVCQIHTSVEAVSRYSVRRGWH